MVYLDERVAYLLGLVLARGELVDTGSVKTIKIEFGVSGLQTIGLTPKTTFNQVDGIHAFFSKQLVEYVDELSEGLVRVSTSGSSIFLSLSYLRETTFWSNLRRLTMGKKSYREFEIHPIVFKSRIEIQKQLVRGFADAAGYVRAKNKDWTGKHRIFIHVANQNWKMPVQLCHLLQDHLEVPVSMIDWGHPNLRAMRNPKSHSWAKEHQIRIYAHEFEKVGLQIDYRQQTLNQLADANRKVGAKIGNYCCPWMKPKPANPAVKHPDEKSANLDPAVRKHFDAYWQICRAAGCVRAP